MSVSLRDRALVKSAALAWLNRLPKKVVATVLAFVLAAILIALQAFWVSTARANDNPVCLREAGCVPVDPLHSTRVEVTKNGAVANGVATDVLTAHAFDHLGNPVRATFELASADPALRLASRTITTGADGTGQVGVTSLKMGSFPVTARVGTVELLGADLPVKLLFVSDAPHADHSTLTVSRSKATAGDPVEVTGAVRDTRNNPISGIRVEFAVSGSATLSADHCLTGADGSCAVAVLGAKAEQVWVSARMDGKGAPVDLKDSPQSVSFSPSGVDPGKSSFAVSPTPTNTDPAKVVANGHDSWTATVTLRDVGGNPIPGRGDVAFAFEPPDAGARATKVVDHGDGTYTATITATRVAAPTVTATAGGRAVGSSVNIAFAAGPVNSSRSSLHLSADRAKAGGQVTATVTAADAFGNPIAGADVVLATSGAATINGAASTNCWTDEAGRCAKALTDAAAERVAVRARIGSVELSGTPAEVVFEAAELDPVRSQFAVYPTLANTARVLADGVDSWTGVLVARDGDGAVRKDVDPALVEFTAPAGVAVSPVLARGDGTFLARFTATEAGEPQVGVSYGGLGVRAPLPISFAAARVVGEAPLTVASYGPSEASLAYSSVTVVPERQSAGAPVTVTLTVRDEQGAAVAGLPESWFAARGSAAGRPALAVGDWVELGGGGYSFQATSRSAGTFQLDATVGGLTLSQHPQVEFTAAAVCVSHCSPGKAAHRTRFEFGRPDAADPDPARRTVYAHAYDGYGNPVAGAAVVLAGPITVTGVTDSSGVATLELGAQPSGTYVGTIDGLTPPGAVIEHQPIVADPARSRLTVTPGSQPAGEPVTVRIQTNDSSGRPVGGVWARLAADSAQVSFAPGAGCVTAVSGPGLGVCEVSVTAKLRGDYRVSASVAGVSIGSAPVRFTAGDVCFTGCTPVDPTHRTGVATVKDGSAADGADLDEVAVRAFDRFGNPVPGVPVAAAAATPGLAVFVPVARTDADGRAIVAFASPATGAAKAVVTLGERGFGQAAPDRPTVAGGSQSTQVSLTFASGKGDPARSSVAIDRPSLPVGQPATLTATVRDASGGPVEGAVVSFVAAAHVQLSAKTCVTGADGACQTQATSRIAGRHQVEATIPDESGAATSLPGSLFARFTPGPVCVAPACVPDPGVPQTRAQLTTTGAPGDGSARDQVTVWAYDAHGNPVPDVRFASTAGPDVAVQPTIAPTGTDGRATIWYTAGAAGTRPATVTFAGLAVGEVELAFGGGVGADPSRSWFESAPEDASAAVPPLAGVGAGRGYQLTAWVRDSADRPVAGAVVSFGVAPLGPSAQTCVTGTDGGCTARLWSAQAGSHTVSARLGADLVGVGLPVVWRADETSDTTPVDPLTAAEELDPPTLWTPGGDSVGGGDSAGGPLAFAGLALLAGAAALVAARLAARRRGRASAGHSRVARPVGTTATCLAFGRTALGRWGGGVVSLFLTWLSRAARLAVAGREAVRAGAATWRVEHSP